MLSRRIIRVKALQVLFSSEIGKDISPVKIEKTLLNNIQEAENLYHIYLLYLVEICNYALVYDAKQENKMLDNNKDVLSSIALADNDIIKLISNDLGFRDFVNFQKLNDFVNKKIVKTLFEELIKKEKYKNYVLLKERSDSDLIDILRFIVKKIMGPSLELEDELGEHYINVEDDSYYSLLSIQKTLKSFDKTDKSVFLREVLLQNDNSELKEFAVQLIERYFDHEDELVDIIKPKLKNWDFDRIATIDIVMLKMAICELKYFPNVPVKVSINEYIDISKDYSTDKSKDFINGILDKIMKDLNEKGQIKKHGRGLIN